MNQRLRGPLALLALLVAGCAAAPGSGPRGAAAPAADAASAFDGIGPERPPPPLVPQPEGTPLPPRDPRIALRWPPEIRHLVDDLWVLFPPRPDGPVVMPEDVERRMRIRLVERAVPKHLAAELRHFEPTQTRFIDPVQDPSGKRASYLIFKRSNRQKLTLVVAPKVTGFCLDPYELAVYMGEALIDHGAVQGRPVSEWRPAYAWGMFDRNGRATYSGLTLSFELERRADRSSEQPGAWCVATVATAGYLPQKKNAEWKGAPLPGFDASQDSIVLPPPLVPQPGGTPLPPPDPTRSRRWPPHVRKVVDDMLALFERHEESRPVSRAEIEGRMQLRLDEKPRSEPPREAPGTRRFAVSGTPFVDPQLAKSNAEEAYLESEDWQSLRLAIGPRSTGYCLDPYELAVYTGEKFIGFGKVPRGRPPSEWPWAYAWGMFETSERGPYVGRRFSIRVDDDGEPASHASGTSCVVTLQVSRSFGSPRGRKRSGG